MSNTLYPKAVTSLDGYFITHVSAGWSHSGFVSGLHSSVSVSTVFVKYMTVHIWKFVVKFAKVVLLTDHDPYSFAFILLLSVRFFCCKIAFETKVILVATFQF